MRKPIKIIAFEDEFLHAEKLKQAVEEIGYSLLSISEDVLKLEELVLDHSPDVVIMDIDLGYGGDGIEAVAKLRRNSNVPVIFLTSFREIDVFAKAKLVYPQGYLVKPVEKGALQRCIDLALQQRIPVQKAEEGPEKESYAPHLFFKTEGALQKVDSNDILYIRSYDKYCFIFTKGSERIMVRERLKNVLGQLCPTQFIQVHRSAVVQVALIERVSSKLNWVEIGNERIAVGEMYKNAVQSKLNIIG